ncbi:MAG: type 1 glutamine amidotransferase domain-containing protein [Acidimicrobiales bacterium]
MKVAFLVANEGIEEVELTEPWKAMEGAGAQPVLIAPADGKAQAMHHLDKATKFKVDKTTADATAGDYDALVLPGGVANSDRLRVDGPAVGFVRSMFEQGNPAAVICHGPWTLVEADMVRGRTLTSWPSLRTDIKNAGGNWVDQEVVTCESGPNTLVTSRKPDDLPKFCTTAVEVFARAKVR